MNLLKRRHKAAPTDYELNYLALVLNAFFPMTPVIRQFQPPLASDRPAAPSGEHGPRHLPEGAALHVDRRLT